MAGTIVAALVRSRITLSTDKAVGLGIQQAVQRLLHGAANNAVEMALDALSPAVGN